MGANAFYHAGGGDLWFLSGQTGSDIALWNELIGAEVPDRIYDPVAEGFSAPQLPPPAWLDSSLTVTSEIFHTVGAEIMCCSALTPQRA